MLPETQAVQAGIVSWSPPNSNWNPWVGANIDEGTTAQSTFGVQFLFGDVWPVGSYLQQRIYDIFSFFILEKIYKS